MSDNVKQVILRDPKTNEILIPKIVGTLGYEPAEDGTLIPPYSNDADTLGGKTADQFAAADHTHDDKYAEKEHDHSGVYATPEQLNEVKTSVAEGKALVAAAVSDKGVETAADATFAAIASAIEQINTGIEVNGAEAVYPIESGETVTAGDFIQIVKHSGWIIGSNTVTAPTVTEINAHNIIKLTDSRIVLVYSEEDTTTTDTPLYVAVIDIATDGKLTLVSGKVVSSSKYAAYYGGSCRVNDTTIFITHAASSSYAYTYGLVVTISSSGTITAGSDTQLSTSASDRAMPIALASNKVLVLWLGVSNATSYGMICTISTRTISKGSQINYTTLTSSHARDVILCNNMILATTMDSQSMLINSSGAMLSLNPISSELFQFDGKQTAIAIGNYVYFIKPASATTFSCGIVSLETSSPNIVVNTTIAAPINIAYSNSGWQNDPTFICTDGDDTIIYACLGADDVLYAFAFKITDTTTVELVSYVATNTIRSYISYMSTNSDVHCNLNMTIAGVAFFNSIGTSVNVGYLSNEPDTVKTATSTIHGVAKTSSTDSNEITVFVP